MGCEQSLRSAIVAVSLWKEQPLEGVQLPDWLRSLAGNVKFERGAIPMWKSRREDEKPYTPPTQPAPVPQYAPPPQSPRPVETPKMESFRADVAHIGKSVLVKGELSGSEDLYLDGEVEGSIELRGHSLVIGPNGRVRANVHAKEIIVHGKVDGNVHGTDKVELKKSALLNGDIFTQRIIIEDGAFFKGAIDIQKSAEPKPEVKPAVTSAVASAAAPTASQSSGSLLDTK
jgi:cytoskeletal protein CcmA (bactofilin family)